MKIIGAGMAGLLCGALNPGSTIYEAGPERTTSNHKALFRCKTGEIGRLLGIPFEEVEVHKAIWLDGKEVEPTPRIAHMYSKKVSGTISARSIFDTKTCTRYIPPEDFMFQIADRCDIEYNSKFYGFEDGWSVPIISTVPMDKLGLDIVFDKKPIYTTQIKLRNCNSNCTIYYPDLSYGTYRASIVGDILICESIESETSNKEDFMILKSLGLVDEDVEEFILEDHKQPYGKIIPIDEKKRKEHIINFTLKNNIYSLGRFATWRPKVMLDDVLEDIFVIRRLIQGGRYASLNHEQGEK